MRRSAEDAQEVALFSQRFEAFGWSHEVAGDQRLVQFREVGVTAHGAGGSVTGDQAGMIAAVVLAGGEIELDVMVDVADLAASLG